MSRTPVVKREADLCVAYLRVSTDEQRLGAPAQRAMIVEWADRQGVRIAGWFEDDGLCGALPADERPGLAGAIDALSTTRAGYLVVAKRDRLARDLMVVGGISRIVEKMGSRVVSAAGEGCGRDVDPEDPSSFLLRSIIDVFAQHELMMIRWRTKMALRVKISRGERVGAVRYGTRLDHTRLHPTRHDPTPKAYLLEPDRREVEAIEMAKRLAGQGLSFGEVGRQLVAAGYPPRKGGDWHRQAVKRLVEARPLAGSTAGSTGA